jgi:hypothetical protein
MTTLLHFLGDYRVLTVKMLKDVSEIGSWNNKGT